MLICRTPFRISLGGGSTDLPSYSRKYGGFIFGVSIDKYMDILVRRPVIYDRIDLQYLKFESVQSVDELKHPIAREALKIVGIKDSISVVFKSETPMGTGLGSSGTCAVGLLNALWAFIGVTKSKEELAEEAFQITQKLGLPDGKQDPYLAALGGFAALDIDTDDSVLAMRPSIKDATANLFFRNSLLIYTGVNRESKKVLESQDNTRALEVKHRMKEIGREILKAFVRGDLDHFGKMMNEHWKLKKETSDEISNSEFDKIYNLAIRNGCLGGKLIGAGGGGYFLFYCPDQSVKSQTSEAMQSAGFRAIPFNIDYKGTRVVEVEI